MLEFLIFFFVFIALVGQILTLLAIPILAVLGIREAIRYFRED